MSNSITVRGVIRGQTVALSHDIDLAEGEVVEVTIVPVFQTAAVPRTPGEGLRKSAGSWADEGDSLDDLPGFGSWAAEGAALDAYLKWCRERRQVPSTRAIP